MKGTDAPAKELLERLVRDFPAKQKYQEELANCSNDFAILLESNRKTAEAEDSYSRAAGLLESLSNRFPTFLDYQSDLGGAWFSQARLLASRQEKEKSCQLLRKAIEHQIIATEGNPRNPRYSALLWPQYRLLLELLVQNGKTDQTQLVLQQAREKCKNLPLVLNTFAWLMVIQSKPPIGDAKQGLEFAKLAVAKAPENGELWNTLGVAHYRAGNWWEAVNALNQSRALRRGGDSYDFFFLAMAYWQLGQKDQAHDWYKKATAALPKKGNPELTRIQEEARKLMEASLIPVDKAAANPK